jgi:uncharacterized membrane protein YfcA
MTPAVILVLTFATLIRSAFGFGEALIAVPLLALLMPVEIAAPTAALVSITVAVVVLLQDWSDVDRPAVVRLIVSTVAGIPLGLVVLTKLPDPLVKGALGSLIVAFAAFSLMRHRQHHLADERRAWLFGFAAGVLGGAYGMNGPPLVVYGVLRGWEPQKFRATLQGYFLPASAAGMVGYSIAGLWTPTVTHFYVMSLPGVAAAIVAGRLLNRRMDAPRFFRYIYIGLVIVGGMLVIQGLRRG